MQELVRGSLRTIVERQATSYRDEGSKERKLLQASNGNEQLVYDPETGGERLNLGQRDGYPL